MFRLPSLFSSSRSRLLTMLGIILFVSFAGVSFINYSITRDSVHEEILRNDLPLTRDNIYSEISLQLMRPIMVSSSMATDTFVKDWALDGEQDVGKIIRYLALIHETYGYFSTFFVSASTGNYYHFDGVQKVINPSDAHDVWFYEFITSGEPYALSVDTNEASDNALTIFINFRVESAAGQLLGVTGVGLRLDSVAKMIEEYQVKYHRAIYLVDTGGTIQVHQNQEEYGGLSIRDIPELAPHADILLSTRHEPVNAEFRRNGSNIMLTSRYIPDLKWAVFVEQDETSALANARMNFLRTILSGLAASLVIISLTLVTINSYNNRIEALTFTDELTGVTNRRGLEDAFTRAEYAVDRYDRKLSLILLDLDHFKQVNDLLGHMVGDDVLRLVTSVIKRAIRPSDTLGRWGGDEFVVIAESDGRESEAMAERIRNMVCDVDMVDGDAPADDPRREVTICCGVTEYRDGDTLDSLIHRADQALYQCKARGGDTVCLFSE